MEKSAPHCKLSVVKMLVESGRVRATASAFSGARVLGINDLDGMCAVVMTLTSANFYKSMTTHADHRIWQDVYHTRTLNDDEVYLKLTVVDDVLIVSFNLETVVGRLRVCILWVVWQGTMRRMAAPCNEEQRSQAAQKACNRRRSGLTRKVKLISNEEHTA